MSEIKIICNQCLAEAPETYHRCAVDALKAQLAEAEMDLKLAYSRLDRWEEQEAMLCPEDVGFEEYIPVLLTQLHQSRASEARLVEALEEAVDWLCPHTEAAIQKAQHPDLRAWCSDCSTYLRAPEDATVHDRCRNLIAEYRAKQSKPARVPVVFDVDEPACLHGCNPICLSPSHVKRPPGVPEDSL